MILIAHRGLLNGPNPALENNPNHIIDTLSKGYDCEVDVWFHNNKWFLGHNGPQYEISYSFITLQGLWIHTKNISALDELTNKPGINFFWHQTDDYTLTSRGYIWSYPGQVNTMNSIMVLPELVDKTLNIVHTSVCAGVCSDYITIIEEKIKG